MPISGTEDVHRTNSGYGKEWEAAEAMVRLKIRGNRSNHISEPVAGTAPITNQQQCNAKSTESADMRAAAAASNARTTAAAQTCNCRL